MSVKSTEWRGLADKPGSIEVPANARHRWAGILSTDEAVTVDVWAVAPEVGAVLIGSAAVAAGRHAIANLPAGTVGGETLRVTMTPAAGVRATGHIVLTWSES